MMNALTSLRRLTTVVADTGDIDVIQRYQTVDATTNPTLILKVTQMPRYRHWVDDAIAWASQQSGDPIQRRRDASDKLVVTIALEILNIISGLVSIEIDARFSYNTQASVDQARRLMALYQQMGGDKQRVLIKLAATWQGIQAARVLQQEGIQCNLTLLFSFAQARACAEAAVYLISPFVGRITDWYQAHNNLQQDLLQSDPGVAFVTQVYHYYKQHGYPTVVMGASFRTLNQIMALAGCDKLTIAPVLLQALADHQAAVPQQLHDPGATATPPIAMTEADFYWLHHQDPMAVSLLAEGICKFALAQEQLDQLIDHRLGDLLI